MTLLRYICLTLLIGHSVASAQQNDVARASISWDKITPEQIGLEVKKDENLWVGKQDLLVSLSHSILYLQSTQSEADYNKLKDLSVSREQILKSITEFKKIVEESSDYETFSKVLAENFELIKPKSAGKTEPVKFTGYFQPTYTASTKKTDKFKYPIYGIPKDFNSWPKPHPKRIFLEGYEGKGNPYSPLDGSEIAFLASRWEAFMIHVQGSAILNLENGEKLAVGFAGATDYPFRGVTKSFLGQHNVSWNRLPEFFARNPELLNQVLVKNNRYIFFKSNGHADPIGSLGVPVIAERSIATDKSIMPPGALSVLSTQLPYFDQNGTVRTRNALRFVLDQDTGSAIKGTNRVDIFMGSGSTGQKKANAVYSKGELYYLLLKSSS